MGSYTRLSSQGRTRTTYHKMPWYHKSANFYGGCLPSREASYLVTASTKDKFNTLWGFLHPCHASSHPLSGPASSLPPHPLIPSQPSGDIYCPSYKYQIDDMTSGDFFTQGYSHIRSPPPFKRATLHTVNGPIATRFLHYLIKMINWFMVRYVK